MTEQQLKFTFVFNTLNSSFILFDKDEVFSSMLPKILHVR